MSGKQHRKNYFNKHRNDKSKFIQKEGSVKQLDENNPILKMFRDFSTVLDAKHDRHERIVKLNRDITIESKRIIFLLHNSATDFEDKREEVFKEADTRLNTLIENNFKNIALELKGQDHYQFLRAYTAGLQEFIEALLFYQFMKTGAIQPCSYLNEKFSYATEEDKTSKLVMPIPMPEYFLGLGDFTGELMRRCINNLSSGNLEDCFKISNFVKHIYTGFLRCNMSGYKDLGRKSFILKQSLSKMEYVCYTIQVRGSEIPRHMLATCINASQGGEADDDDEGYY